MEGINNVQCLTLYPLPCQQCTILYCHKKKNNKKIWSKKIVMITLNPPYIVCQNSQ